MMSARLRTLTVLWGAVVALTTLALPALAQQATGTDPATAPGLVVRSIDATQYPEVTLTVLSRGAQPGAGDLRVEQGGTPVEVQPARLNDTGAPVGVVFVIDGAKAMEADGALDRVRTALQDLVAAKPANQRWGLVQFGATARPVTGLTADPTVFAGAVGRLSISNRQESSLRDGVDLALDMLAAEPGLQPNIVVVNASRDEVSAVGSSALRGSLRTAGAVVLGVNVTGDRLDAGLVERLAEATEGVTVTGTPAEVPDGLRSVLSVVNGQYRLVYRGPADARVVTVAVRNGDAVGTGSVAVGEAASGMFVRPTVAEPVLGRGPSFLRSDTGKLIGLGLALLACMLGAVGVAMILVRDRSSLESALQPYADPFKVETAPEPAPSGVTESRIVQKAVELTSQLAERRGLISRLETALERADLPLRAGEVLFFTVAAGAVATALAVLLTGSLLTAVIVLALFALLPPALLNLRASRRRAAFQQQLPDTLQLLAGSLKAGYSLMQGIEAVSQEVEEPMGRELRRIVVESRLGRPLEDAMQDAADRIGSLDFDWAVMAIRIQRDVGGNLAELLMTVSETMIARDRLRRDVKALVAEGKMSAIVLGILPVALGFVMNVVNPDYMKVLFEERLGNFMLGFAVLLAVGGFFWMKKTIEVDV